MIKSIALVADAFPPSHTSAALQLRDLAFEFSYQGINVTVITPDDGAEHSSSGSQLDDIIVLRLKTLQYKNKGKIYRTISELLMPFFMMRNFRKSSLKNRKWDAVIWYSPTIFLGPFIWYLKRKNTSKSYLILRDIFPKWALDLGLIKSSFVYNFFKVFENFQYSLANIIGVQSSNNLNYFEPLPKNCNAKIEVLHNWLSPKALSPCSISIENLPIANRKIFVYAGNMGIAQGIEDLLVLAEAMLIRQDVGFLFIGAGSNAIDLREAAKTRGLTNVVFCNEIEPEEIPGLYAQCHVGLIALDARHRTHNIPGKFLSYMQAGMPVMAIANNGNDLKSIIDEYQVGRFTIDRDFKNLQILANSLLDEIVVGSKLIEVRCKRLSADMFSSKAAAEKIIQSLNSLT